MQQLIGDPTVAYVFEQDNIDVFLVETCCSGYSWTREKPPEYLPKKYKNLLPFIKSASWKLGNVPQTVLDHIPLGEIKQAMEDINKFSAENTGQYWAYKLVQKIKSVSDHLFAKYEVTLVPEFKIVPNLQRFTGDDTTARTVLRWGNYYEKYEKALEFAPKPQSMSDSLEAAAKAMQNLLLPEAEVIDSSKEEI